MSLTETIPRVLKARLALLGLTKTGLGEKLGTNCDVASKKLTASGRSIPILEEVAAALGMTASEVVADAESLLPVEAPTDAE